MSVNAKTHLTTNINILNQQKNLLEQSNRELGIIKNRDQNSRVLVQRIITRNQNIAISLSQEISRIQEIIRIIDLKKIGPK